jgi:hypothetical protein
VQRGTEDVRLTLQSVGYDGVMTEWDSGEMWAIAFESEQVKVIREG